MTPIFTPDFTTVDATFPTYDRGRYRVKVTEQTPFIRETQPDENGNRKTIAGVHHKLEMVGQFNDEGELDTSLAGKPVSRYTCWLHSEGGWQFAKSFIMAVSGYDPNSEEDQANAELFQAGEWGITGDAGDTAEVIELGESWGAMVDKIVDVTLSKNVTPGEDGAEDRVEQDFRSWAPVRD